MYSAGSTTKISSQPTLTQLQHEALLLQVMGSRLFGTFKLRNNSDGKIAVIDDDQ